MNLKLIAVVAAVLVVAVGSTVAITQNIISPAQAKAETPATKPTPSPAAPPAPMGVQEPIAESERTAATRHVEKISEGKATVAEVFRGPSGYLGVVVNAGEGKFIGWMTSSLDAFFVGAMFDKSGKNVTQTEMLARGYAKIDANAAHGQGLPPQAAIRNAVDKTASFIEGTGGPIVTAFIDFNCGYCRSFYQRSRVFVNAGKMRIKWVPVAILQEDSIGKAAAVLAHPNPSAAVAMTEEDRLPPLSRVSQQWQEKIGANTAVLNLLSGGPGKAGTPTLLVEKRDGTFAVSPGMPQDLGAFLVSSGS